MRKLAGWFVFGAVVGASAWAVAWGAPMAGVAGLVRDRSVSSSTGLDDVARSLDERARGLDLREHDLTNREHDLAGAEKRVAGRLAELTAVREAIEADLQVADAARVTRVADLVKMVSAMKPSEAASVLAATDAALAVDVLAAMNAGKAGKALAAMPPPTAAALAERLTRREAIGSSASTSTDASTGAAPAAPSAAAPAVPAPPAQTPAATAPPTPASAPPSTPGAK